MLAPHAVDIEVTISSLIASLCFTFAEPFDDILLFVKWSCALISGNTTKVYDPRIDRSTRTTKRVNSRSLTKNWSALRNLFSCILPQSTFHYDSKYWSNKYEYNVPGGETGFDKQETKVQSYWNTPFSKICLGMKIDQQLKFIVLNKLANSPYSLIADGQYRNTSLGDMRYDVAHRPLCRLIVTRKGSMLWLSHHILKPESVS